MSALSREEQLRRKREAQARYKAKHPERVRASAQKWRAANPEKAHEATRSWLERNREQALEAMREYRVTHAEERSASFKAWAARNREKLAARSRAYQKAHPEYAKARNARYKARKRGAPISDFTQRDWRELLEEFDYRCYYCGAHGVRLEREHVVPLARGGGHTKSNIVPSCGPCNRVKSTKTGEEFLSCAS